MRPRALGGFLVPSGALLLIYILDTGPDARLFLPARRRGGDFLSLQLRLRAFPQSPRLRRASDVELVVGVVLIGARYARGYRLGLARRRRRDRLGRRRRRWARG